MPGYLIRGILIGLLFGVPVGAVGTMTVQRTFRGGMKAGLLTGLGSSVADCIYACIGVFGLTFVSDFLLHYQTIISLVGGGFIFVMDLRLLFQKNDIDLSADRVEGKVNLFFSSFFVGITNPAAILTFLFAFSWFGIAGRSGLFQGVSLVCGVFIGTYFWWGVLSAAAYWLRKRMGNRFPAINRLFGVILILFSIVIIGRIF